MKLLRLVAMLSRMPRPASTTTRLVPPSETSGSGTPVSGSTPSAAPMLMHGLADDDGRDPRRQQLAERLLAVQGDAKADPRQSAVERR